MPFIPLPFGVRIAMEYNLNGEVIVNVYHATYPTQIVMVNMTALATILIDWWTDNMRQNFSANIALERVRLLSIGGPNDLEYIEDVTPGVPGTGTGGNVPNNVAIVVGGITGYAGRSARGRNYYAAFAPLDVQDNYISGTLATAILADAIALRDQLTTGGWTLGVASFYSQGQPRTIAQFLPYIGFVIDTRVDTQRRRLPNPTV